MQGFEQRYRVLLARGQALVWRTAADVVFDLIQATNALDRLFGEQRVLGDVDLVKMSPCMRHTGNLLGTSGNPGLGLQEQRFEAGIRIDLQLALEARQMFLRIFAVPTRRVL